MTQNNLHISSAAITDKGLSEKRPQNEDSYLELRDSGFYAVADGVGGAQAGDVASQMAMEILGEAFINLQEGGDAEERLKLAIEQANSAIFQMSRDLAQLSTMATTVVGLHVSDNNIATIGHVGDSRLYRVDSEGNLFRETQDHSVVEEEVRAGRLTPEQAAIHPSRNVISRALGAEDIVEIDMKTIMFESGTTFLICSDGVTRHLSDAELKQVLFTEKDPFVICQYIKDVCYDRGAEDNLTAVIVKANENADQGFSGLPDEEETIASARPALANSAVLDELLDGVSPDTLEMPEPSEIQKEFEDDFEEGSPISISANSPNESVVSFGGEDTVESSVEADPFKPEDVKTYRVDENRAGVAGTFLTFLPWVLLAAILALGAYYFLANGEPVSDVNNLQPLSSDVDMAAFEKNRRNVDKNPAKFAADNSNDPRDAADYYLLGRAYFLQKNYDLAKTRLEKAQDLLTEPGSVSNKQVLETEIPLMLAVINSEEAKKFYEQGSPSNASVTETTPSSK